MKTPPSDSCSKEEQRTSIQVSQRDNVQVLISKIIYYSETLQSYIAVSKDSVIKQSLLVAGNLGWMYSQDLLYRKVLSVRLSEVYSSS